MLKQEIEDTKERTKKELYARIHTDKMLLSFMWLVLFGLNIVEDNTIFAGITLILVMTEARSSYIHYGAHKETEC